MRERPDRAQILARADDADARPRRRGPRDRATTDSTGRRPPRRPRAPRRRRARLHPERGADLHDPAPARSASVAQLLELQRERERLTAQTAALPLAELRQLDAITADRARVQSQRRDVADRLKQLPAPTTQRAGPNARSRTPPNAHA